jgi:hypothetical protein
MKNENYIYRDLQSFNPVKNMFNVKSSETLSTSFKLQPLFDSTSYTCPGEEINLLIIRGPSTVLLPGRVSGSAQ